MNSESLLCYTWLLTLLSDSKWVGARFGAKNALTAMSNWQD